MFESTVLYSVSASNQVKTNQVSIRGAVYERLSFYLTRDSRQQNMISNIIYADILEVNAQTRNI